MITCRNCQFCYRKDTEAPCNTCAITQYGSAQWAPNANYLHEQGLVEVFKVEALLAYACKGQTVPTKTLETLITKLKEL